MMYAYNFRTKMHFLLVNVTFFDAFNMTHDIISAANPFPHAAKFMLVGVNNNTQQVYIER